MRDQLDRASIGTVLCIAEGAENERNPARWVNPTFPVSRHLPVAVTVAVAVRACPIRLGFPRSR